jgi:hypothetical protein
MQKACKKLQLKNEEKTILMRRREKMKREFTREQKEILDILAAESYEAWIEDMETTSYLETTFAGKGEYTI